MMPIPLPEPGQRMTPGRKALIVDAFRHRKITLDDIMARYEMTAEEFALWERRLDHYGVRGLSRRGRRMDPEARHACA